jgi:hypothetical protein
VVKVGVLGDPAVGYGTLWCSSSRLRELRCNQNWSWSTFAVVCRKTSLATRYVDGEFKEDYGPTLGVLPTEKTVDTKNCEVTFSVFDLGGELLCHDRNSLCSLCCSLQEMSNFSTTFLSFAMERCVCLNAISPAQLFSEMSGGAAVCVRPDAQEHAD